MRRLAAFSSADEITEYLARDEFAHLTLVYTGNALCVIKSDIIRTWPVFYRHSGDAIEIAETPEQHWRQNVGADQLTQFLAMGYVLGDRTIWDGVYALQSSEIIVFGKSEKKAVRSFSYQSDDPPSITAETPRETAGQELDRILTAIFSDILETVPDASRIVVPLSGGHDSRIVVNYLYKLGFRNVLCYTYGVKDTLQAKISRQVAAALGYEWHFMEYTEDKWQEVQQSGEFDRYLEYGFRGISNPLISDLLPVRELKRRNILKVGDIFTPGHGLDYLAGNDLTEEDFGCTTEEGALDLVFRNSIRAGEYEHRRLEALWPAVSEIYRHAGVDPEQFHLHFFWQEDEAKFIVNSNRLYEYLGYDTRIPLLDIRLIRFWLSVDRSLNIRRKFLFDLEREWLHTDELKLIPFDREVQNTDEKPILSRIKKWIPASVKTMLLYLTGHKKVIDEGQNLVFAKKPQTVAELAGDLNDWPVEARLFFEKDLKRYTHQLPPHYVTRLYILRQII
ncbi:MAG: hypothetical protein ACNA8K_16520 [Cyclonatronaceae bacterium]